MPEWWEQDKPTSEPNFWDADAPIAVIEPEFADPNDATIEFKKSIDMADVNEVPLETAEKGLREFENIKKKKDAIGIGLGPMWDNPEDTRTMRERLGHPAPDTTTINIGSMAKEVPKGVARFLERDVGGFFGGTIYNWIGQFIAEGGRAVDWFSKAGEKDKNRIYNPVAESIIAIGNNISKYGTEARQWYSYQAATGWEAMDEHLRQTDPVSYGAGRLTEGVASSALSVLAMYLSGGTSAALSATSNVNRGLVALSMISAGGGFEHAQNQGENFYWATLHGLADGMTEYAMETTFLEGVGTGTGKLVAGAKEGAEEFFTGMLQNTRAGILENEKKGMSAYQASNKAVKDALAQSPWEVAAGFIGGFGIAGGSDLVQLVKRSEQLAVEAAKEAEKAQAKPTVPKAAPQKPPEAAGGKVYELGDLVKTESGEATVVRLTKDASRPIVRLEDGTEILYEGAKTKKPEFEATPEMAKEINAIQDALAKYDNETLDARELASDIESLEDVSPEIEKALKIFNDALEEDFKMKGRSDLETAENEFVESIRQLTPTPEAAGKGEKISLAKTDIKPEFEQSRRGVAPATSSESKALDELYTERNSISQEIKPFEEKIIKGEKKIRELFRGKKDGKKQAKKAISIAHKNNEILSVEERAKYEELLKSRADIKQAIDENLYGTEEEKEARQRQREIQHRKKIDADTRLETNGHLSREYIEQLNQWAEQNNLEIEEYTSAAGSSEYITIKQINPDRTRSEILKIRLSAHVSGQGSASMFAAPDIDIETDNIHIDIIKELEESINELGKDEEWTLLKSPTPEAKQPTVEEGKAVFDIPVSKDIVEKLKARKSLPIAPSSVRQQVFGSKAIQEGTAPSVASVKENLKFLEDEGVIKVENNRRILVQPTVEAKQPWEMTRGEWENKHTAAKPEIAQSNLTKASGSEAVRKFEEAQKLRYGVHDKAREKIRKASLPETDPEYSYISPEEAEELLDEINTPISHRMVVEKALSEGKPVPPEVLAEYPELKPAEAEEKTVEELKTEERDILGGVDPINQIHIALKSAKAVQPLTKLQKKKELKRRVGRAIGAMKSNVKKGTPTEVAVFKSTGLLKGELAEYDQVYESVEDILEPGAKEAAYQKIYHHPELQYFEILNTITSFKKLLAGTALTPGDVTNIERVFGKTFEDVTSAREEVSDLYDRAVTIWKAGLLTGIKTSGLNTLANLSHSMTETAKDIPATFVDSVASLFTGKRTLGITTKGMPGGMVEGFKRGWKYLKTGTDARNVGQKLDYKRVNFGTSKIAKGLQAYEETIFHILGAEDQPFYYGAKARSLYSQAIAQAKNKGLKGQERRDYIDKTVQNPTDEMLEWAVHDAEVAVFQNRTHLGDVAKSIQRVKGGEIVVPFGRTPSAVATQIINYSPVGYVKAVAERINKGEFDQRKFSQAFGRATVGTGALYIGAQLFKAGLIALDYPDNEKERELWKAEGRKPNSIKVGDKWRDVQTLGPVGNVLVIGGHFQKALESTGSPSQAMIQAMSGGAKSFTEQTFVRGINLTVDAITDPERSFERWFTSMSGSVVPTIVADVARALDERERRTKGPKERIQSRIPILREKLPPKVDIFGQDLPRYGGNVLETMIDPTRPSKIRQDVVVDELRRLWDEDIKVSPTMLGDKDGYDILSKEENTQLWRRAGELTYKVLFSLVLGERYAQLDDFGKGKLVEIVTRQAKEGAKAEMVSIKLSQGASIMDLAESGLLTIDNLEMLKHYSDK